MDRLREAKPNILVVGDLMIDHYLCGKCERISPEAPVQVVEIERETSVLGGAGNVINNLLSLGANVSVLSVIGKDENGRELLNMLEEKGVDTSLIVRQASRKTSKKSRVIAVHQQILRYDKESKEDISKSSEDKLLERFSEVVCNFDAILLSDYGKGVLSNSLTKKIIEISKDKLILVDPKGEDYSKYKGSTLITPNKKEASLATKIDIVDEKSLKELKKRLLQGSPLSRVEGVECKFIDYDKTYDKFEIRG